MKGGDIMKKHISMKNLIVLAGLLMVALPKIANAVSINYEPINTLQLGTRNLTESIMGIIQMIIGFLGIIAIIIVLIGGFKWMTAGGNEEKVAEAKKLLGAGIIGLVIILAAYAITTFVIGTLITATGA
jgi:hypothetical protein